MSGQSRQKIPKLSQLHLNLAFTGMRASGENIQNELCAIDDLEIRHLGNGAGLRRREILVEDHQVGSFLKRAHHHFFEFSLPEQIPLISLVSALCNSVKYADPGGFGQLVQLFQMLLLFGMTLRCRADQNGRFAPAGDVMVGVRSLQIAFEGMQESIQLKVQLMKRDGLQKSADFSLLIRGSRCAKCSRLGSPFSSTPSTPIRSSRRSARWVKSSWLNGSSWRWVRISRRPRSE